MESSEMQAVVQECNFIIIVINDILSLKKEIVSNPPARYPPSMRLTDRT